MKTKAPPDMDIERDQFGATAVVRLKSLNIPVNKVKNVEPESSDWYGLVDFRYILHLFNEWGELKVFPESADAPKGPHSEQQIEWYKDNVNADFLSLDEHVRRGQESTSKAYGFVVEKPEVAKSFFDRCTTPVPSQGKNIPLFQRLLGKTPTPVAYDRDSKHVKLQNAFNAQTNKTTEQHKALEAIIASDITVDSEERQTQLTALGSKITIDMTIYDQLKAEVDIFQQVYHGKGPIMLRHDYTPEDILYFSYYDAILEQLRTSFNLFRAIFLKASIQMIKEAAECYATGFKDEHTAVRERFAGLYLRGINLERELQTFTGLNHGEFLKKLRFDRKTMSFDQAVAYYNEVFETKLFIAAARKFKERYQQAIAAANTNYLLEALDNLDEFKQRFKISERYGEVQDPAAVQSFHQKHLASEGQEKPLKKYVAPQHISSWVGFEQQLQERGSSLEELLALEKTDQKRIAEVLNSGEEEAVADGAILFEFVKTYQQIQSLVGDLRRFPSLSLPQPEYLIEARAYESMAGYLDIAVTVEAERERLALLPKLQKPRSKKTDPDNDTISLLIMDRFDYVKPHERELREIRAKFERSNNPNGYVNFITELLEANDNTKRAEITLRYATQDDSFFQLPILPEEIATSQPTIPARPSIDHLVIVGGYLGHDYKIKLSGEYDVQKVTVLPPHSKRRLQHVESTAYFLVIADHVSHQDTTYLKGKVPRKQWAYASSSGTANLLAAMRKIIL